MEFTLYYGVHPILWSSPYIMEFTLYYEAHPILWSSPYIMRKEREGVFLYHAPFPAEACAAFSETVFYPLIHLNTGDGQQCSIFLKISINIDPCSYNTQA